MRNYEAIESHIRQARLERSAYLGTLMGNALAKAWQAVVAMFAGASAGLEEHRRRSRVASAHAGLSSRI